MPVFLFHRGGNEMVVLGARENRLNLRLHETERDVLERAAAQEGRTCSEWCRDIALQVAMRRLRQRTRKVGQ
jgi:uncharacterized protein (DUF1778 family)